MAIFINDTLGILGLDKRSSEHVGHITLGSSFWKSFQSFPLSWIDFGDDDSLNTIRTRIDYDEKHVKNHTPQVVKSLRELYMKLDNASIDVIPVFGRLHFDSKLFLFVMQSTDIVMGPELRALKYQERSTSGVNLREVFKQALRKRESKLKEQIAERFATLSGSLSRFLHSRNNLR